MKEYTITFTEHQIPHLLSCLKSQIGHLTPLECVSEIRSYNCQLVMLVNTIENQLRIKYAQKNNDYLR